MKKVDLIAHRDDQPAIVNNLQDAGLIEITEMSPDERVDVGDTEKLFRARAEEKGFEVTKFEFIRDFLEKAKPRVGGFISGLIKNRVVLDSKEFKNIDKKMDFEALYGNCEDLDDRLSALEQELVELRGEESYLGQWSELDVRFDEVKQGRHFGLTIGEVKPENLEKLIRELALERTDTDVMVVGSNSKMAGIAIVYYAPRAAALERLLSTHGFERIATDKFKLTASEELSRITARITIIEQQINEINGEIAKLVVHLDDVVVLLDWLRGQQDRFLAQSRFGQTHSTFVLQGWVEEKSEERLREALQANETVIDFDFIEPQKHDKVPVVIRNRGWLRPFETLTRLYGMPNYHELDPTPIMAGFFFLFFGLSIGDFGYGVALVAFCLWLRNRLLITDVGKDWLTLFALGGVASAIVGVFTGSYFSLDPKVLPEILKGFMIIDPLEQAFIFLLATWALGVVHLLAGLGIEFWDSWRRKDYADAINMTLPKIAVLIFASVTITGWFAMTVFDKKDAFFAELTSVGVQGLGVWSLIYVVLSGGTLGWYLKIAKKASVSSWKSGRIESVVAAVVLVLAVISTFVSFTNAPRSLVAISIIVIGMIINSPTRQAVIRLLGGLYNLYSLTAYIGDVLSYSRLMALGLATFLIGFAVNTIAGLVLGFSPWGLPLGIILAVLIAIPLHIFNLVINLLGAFVHPLRLQFVEFFGKFYENGGREFKPFSYEADHLIFKEE